MSTPIFKPEVGCWATHVAGHLDPREVIEISSDGLLVKLDIVGLPSPWLPAENYTYQRPA